MVVVLRKYVRFAPWRGIILCPEGIRSNQIICIEGEIGAKRTSSVLRLIYRWALYAGLKLSFVTAPRSDVNTLVMDNLLLWLLEPILLWSGNTTLRLSLKLDGRVLVCLQLLGDIGFLWRGWCLWWVELEDGSLSVGGLDGGWLVGLELLKVEVLDEIGYYRELGACSQTSHGVNWLQGRTLTDSGWGDESALGDDLAARKASDGGALAGSVLSST